MIRLLLPLTTVEMNFETVGSDQTGVVHGLEMAEWTSRLDILLVIVPWVSEIYIWLFVFLFGNFFLIKQNR